MKYLFSILLVVLATACGGEDKKATQNYEQAKESVKDQETNNPLKFLSVRGENKKNLVGQTVITGNITNSATVVSYKEIRIKMLCYKSGQMTEEHEDVINDQVKPAATKAFKTKYRLPKGTDSIALSVMNAIVVPENKL